MRIVKIKPIKPIDKVGCGHYNLKHSKQIGIVEFISEIKILAL